MGFFIFILILFVVILMITGSLSALKRRRLLEDLPTSKTLGVFIGLVELKGTAETETPLTGFLSELPCVWYSWTVQEEWRKTVTKTVTVNGKFQTKTDTECGWKTVASGVDNRFFYLKDDFGVIRINPSRAEIHAKTVLSRTCRNNDPLYYGKGPSTNIVHSTGKRSFVEQAIPLHQWLYVVGQARERDDCVAAEIAYHSSSPIFLISVSTEERHRTRGLVMFWLLGFPLLLIPFLCGYLSLQELPENFFIGFGIGCVVPLVWGLGWFWMVYNSLIRLKNRVKTAAANIDVELKRRFDLIPQLVRTVEGMQRHEKDTQETLALLRSQSGIQSVQDGEAKGCRNQLTALAENYPELKADETFMKLQKNLVETEQRIALARGYYNDIVETLNSRCERFPENKIAMIVRMKPIPFFAAEDFERGKVNVTLIE
jgi:hypothetical protein